jgi:uncharacterized membrane protein YphA (DoxX/SURF4 family)
MAEIARVLLLGVLILAAAFLFTPYEAILEGILAIILVAAVVLGFTLYPRRDVFHLRTTLTVATPDGNLVLEHDYLAVKVQLVRLWLLFLPTLLAVMFFSFVCMIHLPNLLPHLKERLFWTIPLRDAVFGAGALALAGALRKGADGRGSNWPITFGRLLIAAALIFFGAQECLYPKFAPGVPLPKMTPAWVPLPVLWGFLCGIILIVCGVCLLVNKYARSAAACAGAVMAVLTLILYVPILLLNSGTGPLVEGLNYVADTLLFGGALLFLARALPKESSSVSAT